MAHRLRMSAELGDWLDELCTSEPASAAEVAAALTVVMTAPDPSTLELVDPPVSGPTDPREVVDQLYQDMLAALQPVRWEAAQAATESRYWAPQIAAAEAAGQPDDVLAYLRQRLAKAEGRQRDLTRRSQRLRDEVDAFRAAKETAKAMYTAADATLRIQDAVETATTESPAPAHDEQAAQREAVEAAEAHLHAVAAQAAAILRKIIEAGSDKNQRQPPRDPVAGLLELRADPLGRDVRLLFAVEPADAVTVLAVLDGEEAITEHRAQAIELAGDLLTDIRAGAWPPADADAPADIEVTFADSATFLARFFPADTGAIATRAADLGAARSLAGLRGGMSLAGLSSKTGISEQRLRDIEARGLRDAEVHEAAAYVRALGGRLTLTARLAESGPVLLA